MRICVPIMGKNLKEFLLNLKKAEKASDWVELRTDYINDFSIGDVAAIKKAVKKNAIFTCRKADEGGKFKGSESERLEILKQALKSGFDFVDIEFSVIGKISKSQKNKNTKIISSWHDFKKTPDYITLEGLYKKMKKYRPDIIKIVTTVNNNEDLKTLFKLLANKDKDQEMIVLGMGENGRLTRILSPLLGGYLTFAFIGKSKSAPGQIEISKLKNIYKTICS